MSIWIRAICIRSIGSLADIELRDATRDADFMIWGESYDLDDAQTQAIEDALRFERGKAKTRDVTLMRYRPNEPDRFVRIERWTGKTAREELRKLEERIADIAAPAATRVRDVLTQAIETVGFELKVSDAQGMGWPISWQTAMWLARGGGLVVTDDPDEWWDPDSYEIVLAE